ncbi:ChaN family lipoprotein [Leisingera aquaemixtae]|uniref:ChaN family lipoprotein n=1 Tax=Leisingera aquaemixtae TaxID=1396826 RepID=UPI0021A5FA3E|nr:ChaN family lipoprotein [Leisingera aquaemixtae]UWQ24176.1 ChaN family lipoprotein [Leisingera aquaemixtae]
MRKRLTVLKTLASAAVLAAFGLSGARAGDLAAAAGLLRGADVAILGEVHDNAVHHQRQAALLAELQPKAVVWEMITAEQAESLNPATLADAEQVAQALDWAQSGWPEFSLYAPVFAAAQGARQYGALVPRAEAARALEQGAAAYFGAEAAARFGLDQPLPAAEQAVREGDQLASHCNAMPAEMLPVLVDIQRLRDASLAAAADRALAETGGPVAVITGNGHARADRGLAVYLAKARPEARIRSLGQSEAGQISGSFDLVLDAPAAERPDPCLAFQNSN